MILAIDTSLGSGVAVVEPDGYVRSAVTSDEPLGHAEAIGRLLVAALAEASVTPHDITHVAAGMGPGPFTGLRIGIAAARTFAQARSVAVVGVPSHDAVALGALLGDAAAGAEDPDEFAVVTDARRREFARTLYRGLDDDGLPVRTSGPQLGSREVTDAALAGLRRIDAAAIPPAMIGLAAARAVAAGRTLTGPEPLYLRAPDVTLSAAPKRVST